MTWDNPLYVRGYSQSVLNKALSADTQFLASQLVMDYSLLVGIDDDNNQLIVGLIGKTFRSIIVPFNFICKDFFFFLQNSCIFLDYIRTFTWDKRLETFVKSSGILGGQGKMPTVVSPELYRTRFCEAMNRRFLRTIQDKQVFNGFLFFLNISSGYFTSVPSFWD